eukprot:scaffold13549_cov148-Skeletonema_marinoi.AAC.2
MANYHGYLEAVDCHTQRARNDMVLESRAGGWRLSQLPHQVTYEQPPALLSSTISYLTLLIRQLTASSVPF